MDQGGASRWAVDGVSEDATIHGDVPSWRSIEQLATSGRLPVTGGRRRNRDGTTSCCSTSTLRECWAALAQVARRPTACSHSLGGRAALAVSPKNWASSSPWVCSSASSAIQAFVDPDTLLNLTASNAFVGIAIGMFLLALREIDLSIGWIFNFSAVVCALAMRNGVDVRAGLGIVLEAYLGLFNGLLAVGLRLPGNRHWGAVDVPRPVPVGRIHVLSAARGPQAS